MADTGVQNHGPADIWHSFWHHKWTGICGCVGENEVDDSELINSVCPHLAVIGPFQLQGKGGNYCQIGIGGTP